MKNARYCAALFITGCAQQTFTVQNKPAQQLEAKPSPSFLRFWNWAEETVDSHKFVAAQKMLLKQKPSKHS